MALSRGLRPATLPPARRLRKAALGVITTTTGTWTCLSQSGLNGHDLLYQNNGDGTFIKTIAGAVVTSGGSSRGCAWGDYDNDGYIDLFVSNERGQNNFLFHNNGDGTFAKVASGKIVSDGGYSTACAWGDYDNDGYLDLFVPNNNETNFLYHNNRDGTFTKIATGRVVTDGGSSFGSAWGDYDNDGYLDLFVANQNQKNFLYHNNGDGTFTRVTSGQITTDVGYSWGAAWADYDNDGFLDLFVANGRCHWRWMCLGRLQQRRFSRPVCHKPQ